MILAFLGLLLSSLLFGRQRVAVPLREVRRGRRPHCRCDRRRARLHRRGDRADPSLRRPLGRSGPAAPVPALTPVRPFRPLHGQGYPHLPLRHFAQLPCPTPSSGHQAAPRRALPLVRGAASRSGD
ncbi:hypothetical protein CALCODRAFT_373351 [Calocera cornea HHB12733]|uniref:Secreted protein n=1 Tax=Calocera cornea HHB12733 TaxID=1353952 RepID=A0A165EG17_9BASI|nr:hypothetical protein CALCODRAFT_373351 [Calocera cornea HHB12733]